ASVDGNDVEQVFQATKKAARLARSGGGPTFIEARTYRFTGHSRSDKQVYRKKEEVRSYRLEDPIVRYEKQLKDLIGYRAKDFALLKKQIKKNVEAAKAFAQSSKSPSEKMIDSYVFAEKKGEQ